MMEFRETYASLYFHLYCSFGLKSIIEAFMQVFVVTFAPISGRIKRTENYIVFSVMRVEAPGPA